MPFDYNSFLQGVQTGLRLGRTTQGRQPPFPPVPSGRYILTESGEHIFTELESDTILTFGATNKVYTNPVWPNSRLVFSVSDGKDYSIFGADYGSQSEHHYVLLSNESFVGKTITYTYSWGSESNPVQGTLTEGPIAEGYQPSKGGSLFMYVFTSAWRGYPLISPDDMTYISYSMDFTLVNLVASIRSSPLITEGG